MPSFVFTYRAAPALITADDLSGITRSVSAWAMAGWRTWSRTGVNCNEINVVAGCHRRVPGHFA